MDYSLLSAGRNVHVKIVSVAIAGAIVIFLVGINAKTGDVASTSIKANGPVIEAGRGVTRF